RRGAARGKPQYLPPVVLRIRGHSLRAEVARTPRERRLGLMFREDLNPDEGMLFLFPRIEQQSFWMRNTPLPLSIAYVAGDGVISQIEKLEPFDEQSVRSKDAVPFALEVHRGWFRRNGITVGDPVDGLEEVVARRAFRPR
ncbi:DUF192 domain-containing protein, partial [Planctomycetota bacterium]